MAFENLGSGFAQWGGQLTGAFSVFLKAIIWAVVAAVVGFIVYKTFFEYPIKITLIRKIGKGSMAWHTDKAKIYTNKDDNTEMLVLMRRWNKKRMNTAVPTSEFRGKSGKADHYIFLLDDNFQLQPVKSIDESTWDSPELKLFPEDKRWWARKEDKRRLEKYHDKSKLEKFLPSIVMLAAFLFTFLIAYFGFTTLADGMNSLASQFAQVASSCTAIIAN